MSTQPGPAAGPGGVTASAVGSPPSAPVLGYRSDAGPDQDVCQLSQAGRLKELCFDGFSAAQGTFCVWLQVPSTAAAGATVLAYQPPGASGAPRLDLVNPQNLEVRVGGTSGGPTGVPIADGVWRQLAVAYQRAAPSTWIMTVYVDSLPVWLSRALRSPLTFTAGGDLYLGWDGASGGDLPGLASELQVWSSALDDRAIATGLLRRSADGTAGLALHWPLDVPPPGNPNAAIVASQLRFRTGAATLSWAAAVGATSYDVEAGSTDGRWNATASVAAPGTSWVLPGSPLGTRLGGRYRAQLTAGPTPWSQVTEIAAFELIQTAVTLTWDSTASVLQASWPDVPRRDSFTLELYQAGSTQPDTTAGYTQLSYPLTTKLDDPSGWRLDVRAFAAGSLGPAQPALPLTAPALTGVRYDLTGRVLTVNWAAVPGAQYFRLLVTPGSGQQQPYALTLDGATLTATVANAQYPLQAGVSYTIAVRALGSGSLTAWASQAVTVHDVPAPVPSWAVAPSPGLLDAAWNEVAAGASYDLALYRGSDPNPVLRQSGLTTRTFSFGSYLADNSSYAVKVAAIDAGVEGPVNVPGPITALGLAWHYVAATQTLAAGWAAGQPDAYLSVASSGGAVPQPVIGTGSQATFPAPAADYPEGTQLTLTGRGLATGALGLIESAALTVHLLTTPVPTLRYREPTAGAAALAVTWPAINPPLAVAYQVQATVNGTAGPVQGAVGTEFDVTPLLETAGAITIAVRGTADGSIGAWSTATAPGVPAWQALRYDVAAAAITGTWTVGTGLDAVDADLTHSGAVAADLRQWLAGSATTTTLPVPQPLTGQAVTARLRAVAGAAMSDFAAQTMTLLQVPGPLLSPLTDTVSPNSISASWSFDIPAGTTGLGYIAQLSSGGTVLATNAVTDPATKSTTFNETGGTAFQPDTLYTVTVRAQVQPAAGQVILGAWSSPASINFGTDVNLALASVTPNSSASGDITLTWSMATPVAGATFEVQITETNFDRTGLTGTYAELSQSDTHVTVGNTYTVQMRAIYGTITGPWYQTKVTAGQPPPPNPGPSRNDPVVIRTGALAQSGVDLLVPAVVPLAFAVAYRSDSPLPTGNPPLPSTPLGARWSHAYNTKIIKAADGKTVALVGGDLSVVTYQVPASITGSYPQQGIPNGSSLFAGADLSYTLTRADGSTAGFDPAGTMQWMADPAGNRTQLSYSDGRLNRVTDAGSGRWLQFSYDANGRITTVAASTGISAGYGYDSSGNLISATDPLGTRTFSYDTASRMTGATDQLQRPSLRNVYDSQGRITLQQDARALAGNQSYGTSFAYSSGGGTDTVTVTNRDGEVTTYGFDSGTGFLAIQTVQLAPGFVQRVSYTRDANGNALAVSVFEGQANSTDAGLTWRYTYDGIGNVTSVTDPLLGTTSTAYDGANHPVRVTDRLGNTTVLQWSGNLLTKVTDPLNGEATWTYAPGPIGGLIATQTDRYGAAISYDYDAAGQLTRLTDRTAAVTIAAWGPLGWPASFTRQTADGQITFVRETDTNAMGMPVAQRDRYAGQPAGSPFTTAWQYAPTGTPVSVTDPLNAVTTLAYDPNLLLTQITYPAGTPPGDHTGYGYDRENRLISIDHGAGMVEGFTADPLGRPASYTDPNRSTWRIGYAMSGQNLVQTVTVPLTDPATGQPLTESLAIDPLGRPAARTDTAGGITTISYATVTMPGTNTFGLQVTTTLPAISGSTAISRSQTFDAIGRLAASVDENGKPTSYAYAPASSAPDPPPGAVLAVTVTRPTTIAELYLLDGAGRLLQVRRGTGATQRITNLTYDPVGRVTSVTQAGGGLADTAACGYAWNSGAVTASVSAAGTDGPVLSYDPLGRLLAVKDRAGQSVSYQYTPAGLLSGFTNARDQQVGYTHDAAARLTGIALPAGGGTIDHVLDANGNRVQTLLSGQPSVIRTFDALDRMTSRTAAGASVGFSYDALGGLATVSYPAQQGQDPPRVAYQRDALGRLTSVSDWEGRQTSYGYLPTGALASCQAPNGVHTDLSYDDDGRLLTVTTSLSGLVIADASYGYDAFDAPVTLRELLPATARPDTGTQTLTYAGDRLAAVNGFPVTIDNDGNLIAAPGTPGPLAYGPFGDPVSAGPVTLQRDADGVLSGVTGDGRDRTFVSDQGGYASPGLEQADPPRQVRGARWQPLPAGGFAIAPVLFAAAGVPGAGYDMTAPVVPAIGVAGTGPGWDLAGPGLASPWQPGGALVSAVGPPPATGATSPAWSPPLAALDRRLTETAGGQTTRYVHGVGLIGAERPDGSFASYVFDGQGSTLALALADGTLAGRQSYDAFGSVIGGDPVTQPFGLAGRLGVATEIAGLPYMRARCYATRLFRFTSQDYLIGALADPQSLNRYLYLRGSPLLRADPLGADGWPLWGTIVLGVLGGLAAIGAIIGGLYAAGVLGGTTVAPAAALPVAPAALPATSGLQTLGNAARSANDLFRQTANGLRQRFRGYRQVGADPGDVELDVF